MIIGLKKYLVVALILISGGLALSACGAGSILAVQTEPTPIPTVTGNSAVTVEGRVVPLRFSALGFQTGGEIVEIPVAEGDEVVQGTLLVRLGKREPLEAALSSARLEELAAQQALDDLVETADLVKSEAGQALEAARRAVIDAQKALNDLDTPEFREELDDKTVAMQDARDAMDDAQTELDKYIDLDEENPTRERAQDAFDETQNEYEDAVYDRDLLKNQLDQTRASMDLATAQLDNAQREFDRRQDGPDPKQLALAQTRLDNAIAQVAAAQRMLDNMDLIAPYAGIVVDLYDLEPGEIAQPGMPVVTLADFSTWYVETRDLTELEVVDVEVGQEVIIIPDALVEAELSGEVVSIDRFFTERSGDILYTVRIRLDETDVPLRWGMTVIATFDE